MSDIQQQIEQAQQAVQDSETRLGDALSRLAHHARPKVQLQRKVIERPHAAWLGAFALGFAMGWLQQRRRGLL